MRRWFSFILVMHLIAGTANGQDPAGASIVFDGTLGGKIGAAPSYIDADDNVRVYEIGEDRGTYSGANLFHSFQQFSILSGEGALFTAKNGAPERIIARVTGASKSVINGWLGSTVMYELDGEQHAADIYFVNPYGISVGGNAVVDVPGSLYLSTAHVIGFENGPDFHTHGMDGGAHAMGMLLSAAAPASFGFTDPHAFGLSDAQAKDFGQIRVERRSSDFPKFFVEPGKTLAFIGADTPSGNSGIKLASSYRSGDPVDFVEIDARDANVQIASAGGVVDIPVDIRNLDPTLEDSQPLGHVSINNFFTIFTGDPKEASTTGEIVIRGGRFALTRNSTLSAASLDVGVTDWMQIAGDVVASAKNIKMVGSNLVVTDLSADSTPKSGALIEGGSVELTADEIEISGDSTVQVKTRLGDGGLLEINANVLRIERGGKLQSLAETFGIGGDINITADDRVVVTGSSCPSSMECGRSIISARSEEVTGDAGEIRIEAPVVEIVDGGAIEVFDTAGSGQIYGITILASDRVTIARGSEADGPSIVRSQSDGAGNAGGLRIAPLDGSDLLRVELHDGGQASASTSGTAAGGSVEITADVVEVIGAFSNPGAVDQESGIFSQSTLTHNDDNVGGSAGSVAIAARSLVIGDRGRIGVGTSGDGDAGIILLSIGENLVIFGPVNAGDLGNIEASNRVSNAAGKPGDIEIRVSDPNGSVVLRDGAVITAQSMGPKPSGNVTIDAGGHFEAIGFSVSDDGITTRSGVTTASKFSSGGNITIAASNLVYLLDGEISTKVALDAGGGGNVVIGPEWSVPKFVVLNEGRVNTSAEAGKGGNIDITAGTFFASAPFAINPGRPFPNTGSILDASSKISGLTGTINVEPPETELVTELAALPAAFLDASALLGSACEARTSRAGSFQVSKRRAADFAPPDTALAPLGLHAVPSGVRVVPASADLCASPEETL